MPDVAAKFIYRVGTAAEWTASNPVLALAEPGYVSDTKVWKIGDGVTAFDSLPSYPNATALNAAVVTANAAAADAASATAAAAAASAAATAANVTANAALAAVTGSAVGSIVWFPGTAAPGGFVKANGALLSRTTYAALWAYAQASGCYTTEANKIALRRWGWFGSGDGSTTFSIPDLRGLNLMSWDDGRGLDAGRVLMDYQEPMLINHTHGVTQTPHSHGISDPGHGHGVTQSPHSHSITDPGHSHGSSVFRSGIASFIMVTTGGGLHGQGNVDGSTTGITGTNGANANVSVNNGNTGITGTLSQTVSLTVNTAGDGADNRIASLAALACIKY